MSEPNDVVAQRREPFIPVLYDELPFNMQLVLADYLNPKYRLRTSTKFTTSLQMAFCHISANMMRNTQFNSPAQVANALFCRGIDVGLWSKDSLGSRRRDIDVRAFIHNWVRNERRNYRVRGAKPY